MMTSHRLQYDVILAPYAYLVHLYLSLCVCIQMLVNVYTLADLLGKQEEVLLGRMDIQ